MAEMETGEQEQQQSQMVILQSNEGIKFEVSKALALKSDTIKDLLCHCLSEPESEAPVIPLPNVNTFVLEKIVTWLRNHEAEMNMNADQMRDHTVVDEFDKEFFRGMDQIQHFDVINAANYLNIKRLLDNGCKLIAAQLVGKSVEQIRTEFNIINDYTPEEEEQLRRENAWLED